MGLIELASGASAWRGYDYYENNKVLSHNKTGENKYAGTVQGNGRKYDVEINLEHPRSSSCNCPHANGKRIVCKHMVALYFAVFPKDAQRFYKDTVIAQEEEEERQEKLENALIDHVSKMRKADLEEALLQVLFDGPEWQYEQFLREHIDEYWE